MLLFALNDGNVAVHFIQCWLAAQQGAQHLSRHPKLWRPSLLLLAVPLSWYLVRFGEKGIHWLLLQRGDICSHPDVIIMITLLHSDNFPPFTTLWEPTMWFSSLLRYSTVGNPVHLWPWHPHHTTSVVLPFWMLTQWPYNAVIASSVALFDLFIIQVYWNKTSQARIKIQVSSQETLDLCSAQCWGKLPGPHSLSSWPHPPDTWWSSLILLWRCLGRGGLLRNRHLMGYRLCAYTNITPTTQIFYVVSIGWRHVPLHLLVWWPQLLPVFCFAARPCHRTSLVVSVEGHRQTCLPLQESLTARCVVITICRPVFQGMLLQIPIFLFSGALAMIHLPCQIIPLLSVSLPQHIQAIDLLYFALTGSHWQCVHDKGICWVLVQSDGCECAVPLVTRHVLMRNSHSASSHLQNSPQEMSFIFWHRLSTCCLPPSLMTNNLAQLYC